MNLPIPPTSLPPRPPLPLSFATYPPLPPLSRPPPAPTTISQTYPPSYPHPVPPPLTPIPPSTITYPTHPQLPYPIYPSYPSYLASLNNNVAPTLPSPEGPATHSNIPPNKHQPIAQSMPSGKKRFVFRLGAKTFTLLFDGGRVNQGT
jgi:hypothetical protein